MYPSKPRSPSPPAIADHGSTIRVVAVRTGLGMETLRAWERRFGFPTPHRRTGSNRRLYSAADVERLLVIRRALDQGYRVGDVIRKSKEELDALAAGAALSAQARPVYGGAATRGVEGLVELLAQDRVSELEVELRRAADALGPRQFAVELAHPLMVKVGAAWAGGQLFIRHEHLAAECLVTQLRRMLARYQDIEAHPRVLLATLPGEPHTLPMQIVALYLVALGAKPRLLGGSTPPSEIVDSVEVLGADALGLTVTAASDLTQTRRDVKTLRRRLPAGVEIWIGGDGATSLGIEDERTHVVISWAEIDQAIARTRGPRKRRLAR